MSETGVRLLRVHSKLVDAHDILDSIVKRDYIGHGKTTRMRINWAIVEVAEALRTVESALESVSHDQEQS